MSEVTLVSHWCHFLIWEGCSSERRGMGSAFHMLCPRHSGHLTHTAQGSWVVQWCWIKLPVPRCPNNLNNSRAWTYCSCSGCRLGLFGLFFSPLSFLSSSLSLGDGQYRLKYCLKGPLNTKQPNNQPPLPLGYGKPLPLPPSFIVLHLKNKN